MLDKSQEEVQGEDLQGEDLHGEELHHTKTTCSHFAWATKTLNPGYTKPHELTTCSIRPLTCGIIGALRSIHTAMPHDQSVPWYMRHTKAENYINMGQDFVG